MGIADLMLAASASSVRSREANEAPPSPSRPVEEPISTRWLPGRFTRAVM